MPFYKGAAVTLTGSDFDKIADEFGVEVALIKAVNAVEARGKGFRNGMVTALYEPHIAYRYSSGTKRNALVKAGLAYAKWMPGKYPPTSYGRIDAAAKIAGEELAATATSWGLGQIMGFNYRAAGYGSAVDMVRAFADSEANQLRGMMNFIKSNYAMMAALKRKDFAQFALMYNGKDYKKNKYDIKLETEYNKYSGNAPLGLTTVTVTTDEPVDEYPVYESLWSKLFRLGAEWLRRRKGQ